MENFTGQPAEANPHKNKVHKILAHSYLFCFTSFLLGLSLDFIFPLKFFGKFDLLSWGTTFLILGTVLIVWAQKSSHGLKKENLSAKTFLSGPYRYSRTPTHWGIFLLALGFAIIANAPFVAIFSLASFIIARFTFIRKEEEILALKYGAPYLEYKKAVRL